MLPFDAGRELIAAGGHDGFLSDPFPAAERRQRWIREHGAGSRQFLMDSHEVALARGQQLEDLLAEGRGFLGALDLRHGTGVRLQHLADALA